MMDKSRIEVKRYISVCVGIFGLVFYGIILGFNIYAVALKETFNYTQTELEYIAASGIVGSEITSYLTGIAVDRFGPRSTCVVAAILSSSCFALMWMATKFISFFASRSWIMCLIYFMAASGCCMNFLACMAPISLNFKENHRGKIVGFASATIGASPLIFTAIYQGFFVQGHVTDEQNQHIGDFFVLLSIWAACAYSLCAAFLKIIPPEDTSIALYLKGEGKDPSPCNDQNDATNIETNIDHAIANLVNANEGNETNQNDNKLNDKTPLFQKDSDSKNNKPDSFNCKDITCFQMMKTLKFHLLLWIAILIRGIGWTFAANITTMAKSAHLETASAILLMIIPIANTLSRFFVGFIPDVLKQRFTWIPLSSSLLVASLLMMMGQTILIFFNQHLAALVCFCVMSSISCGFISTLVPIFIIELFGMKEFSQKLGLVFTLVGIVAFPFAKIFGVIYEQNSPPSSNDCFGVHCSRWTYVSMAILSFLSVALSAALMKAEHKKHSS
ncbi:unnamed protein product [Owenia fusiformis]|uniref:Uncharacterized protein n=1 Tax=Owenia fusiformis TaxID=6347 RepID=A0A8J1Y9Y8_OWEFU|nr:unnamed protein product [Owenia fusiformis]